MAGHPSVVARLDRLAPDQRAAATAPPGPILCVAPAGSGKTTTLVARIAWLIDGGADPATIAAITFNKRAADELGERLAKALEPLGVEPGAVRVRTFHALGLEILRSAGRPVEPLVDRMAVLREIAPGAAPAVLRRLDDAFSRLKLDLGVTAEEVAADPDAGPVARAFVAYERTIERLGGLDFDDLVARTLRLLDAEPAVLTAWRRACTHLLVDEVQDVDRSQLRLALQLAAPEHRIFLVGDDDQSIYGWRLADVRRVLELAGSLPGLRRVDLVTNYRCPGPVVERAVRLVECNRERFAKVVTARPGATGRLFLAPDGADDVERVGRILDAWPDDGGTRAFLARTNRELLPVLVVALERRLPFRADRVATPLDDPRLDALLAEAAMTDPRLPLLVRVGRVVAQIVTDEVDSDDPAFTRREVASALLAWAAPYPDLDALTTAVAERRDLLARLRTGDAALSLATAHATKGLEFDHVAVLGMEAGRFPSGRAIGEAEDPSRALEEERRLAYVAWTRARRTLILSFDPDVASPFLGEAFAPDELPSTRSPPGAERWSGGVLFLVGPSETHDEAPEQDGGSRRDQDEADIEDRPGPVADGAGAVARGQCARHPTETGDRIECVDLVGRLEAVDLGDDVEHRGDDHQDAHEPERLGVVVGVAGELDREGPQQDHGGQRRGDRQSQADVQVRHEEDHAQGERQDHEPVPDQHVRQPPDVAAEAQRQRPKEPDDVRAREVEHEGEGPQDRQDRGDRQDEPAGAATGQCVCEFVGSHRWGSSDWDCAGGRRTVV
jgi:superfamily I DNA/RNA helicase